MEKYVVRQPILDNKKEVYAYEILWRDDSEHMERADITAANAIDDFFYELNNQEFLDGKTTFITFTPNLLLKNIPKMFTSSSLVIQIDDSVLVHPLARKIIYRFKKQGYQVAICDFEFAPRYFSILDIVDYIKVNFANQSETSIRNIVNMGANMKKSIIAYNVNTPETYDLAVELGCDFLEGANVAQQFSSKVHRMDHLQSNFFQLMIAITRDEPNIDEITEIISRDVTLAFPLIKLVNSAYFALRNRATDVHQAIVALGLSQLRQWIYLLGTADAQGELDASQEEMLKLSLTRATFASELMKYAKDMPISRNDAYLMGMFSTLTYLIAAPMEEILADIPVAQPVKDALINHEGRCGVLYDLVINYGRADWAAIGEQAKELGLPEDQLADIYFRCVEEVNRIWQQLMDTSGVN